MKAVAVFVAAVLAISCFAAAPAAAVDDVDILNFALNLEYLEAEFYARATTGSGYEASLRGGGPAAVGGSKVKFGSNNNRDIAEEIASDELKHVKFLRLALGKAAVPQPEINVGTAFADAADAALGMKLNPRFSPYAESANDLLFFHGAFIFEDVGVTAYKGAANKIKSKNFLQYAAGILAVEAYHAGTVRTLLALKANSVVAPYGAKVSTIVGAISALRAKLGNGKDQGLIRNGKLNITPLNGNAITYGRTTDEVIAIVTAGAANKQGLFFPKGLNGNLK